MCIPMPYVNKVAPFSVSKPATTDSAAASNTYTDAIVRIIDKTPIIPGTRYLTIID